MPEEPLRTFRVRADMLIEAHGLLHAIGLLLVYLSQWRAGVSALDRQKLLLGGGIAIEPSSPAVKLGPSDELRALRLYHWRRVLAASKGREDRRASRHTVKEHDAAYDLHMKAVQALNDCFPIGDYADDDDELDRRNLKREPPCTPL